MHIFQDINPDVVILPERVKIRMTVLTERFFGKNIMWAQCFGKTWIDAVGYK